MILLLTGRVGLTIFDALTLSSKDFHKLSLPATQQRVNFAKPQLSI